MPQKTETWLDEALQAHKPAVQRLVKELYQHLSQQDLLDILNTTPEKTATGIYKAIYRHWAKVGWTVQQIHQVLAGINYVMPVQGILPYFPTWELQGLNVQLNAEITVGSLVNQRASHFILPKGVHGTIDYDEWPLRQIPITLVEEGFPIPVEFLNEGRVYRTWVKWEAIDPWWPPGE